MIFIEFTDGDVGFLGYADFLGGCVTDAASYGQPRSWRISCRDPHTLRITADRPAFYLNSFRLGLHVRLVVICQRLN